MADTRAFNLYFANRGSLPGDVAITGDELLFLRSGTVYRGSGAAAGAYASMTDNAVETTINTIDVWVPFGGVLIEGATTPNFTFAANEFTYIGPSQASYAGLSGKMSVLRVGGGGNSNYQVGVFVNAVQVSDPMTVSSSSTFLGFVLTEVPHLLQTGDIIDIRIRNTTGAENALVTDAQLIVG
jgi:hypothetical protein